MRYDTWTRAAVAASCALLALGAADTAHAQQVSDTEINGSFELKLGGFYPGQIDAETGGEGQGSFANFYGTDSLLYGEFVYERYLFQKFGKLGLGLHVGFTRKTGEVQTADGADSGADDASSDEAAVPGETTFRLVPLRGSVFYRYDYSALHHNIPLAPIVRAGVDYYLWRILDSDGETSTVGGEAARGGKWGWHASVGLQFLLDYIDPSSAASFDVSWGINNSYLFAEYMITRVDGFGAEGLDFSDNLWMFGLAFEF